jgi:hypothetical protein
MRTMKPARSMIFEKDHLRRVKDWIPGDVVVHVRIATHITTLPMRKTTLSQVLGQGSTSVVPDAHPRSGKRYPDYALARSG